MKAQYQVKTQEFEYIMLESEVDSPEAAVEAYNALKRAYSPKAGLGLPEKEFKAAIDEYLSTASLKGGTELYAKMNPEQQRTFQDIKKSLARIESRLEKSPEDESVYGNPGRGENGDYSNMD